MSYALNQIYPLVLVTIIHSMPSHGWQYRGIPLNHGTNGLGPNDCNLEGQGPAVSWCLGLSNVLWTGFGR